VAFAADGGAGRGEGDEITPPHDRSLEFEGHDTGKNVAET
jgi:hypothetical protein